MVPQWGPHMVNCLNSSNQSMPRETEALPDFFIIGAAKSGTSTLFGYLNRHPGIHMSSIKEPCFFDTDVGWHKGWEWYRSLFSEALPGQLCGEASTNYTRWPQVLDVPARISKHLPNAKFIYILREPVTWAYSHYVHRYTKEIHPGEPFRESFEDFVNHDPVCLDSSDYLQQIHQYLAHFTRDSMLFLLLDDLQRNPVEVLERVFQFLGIDTSPSVFEGGEIHSNEATVFRRAKLRGQITRPLRRVSLIRTLASMLPQSWSDAVYTSLRKTKYARGVGSRHEAKPMKPETRVWP